MNIIGSLDWQDCDTCRHYRDKEGGCDPLEECRESILSIDLDFDRVRCDRYEKKIKGGRESVRLTINGKGHRGAVHADEIRLPHKMVA